MNKWILIFALPFLLLACKDKKNGAEGEGVMKIGDFLALFPKKNLPYQLNDSTVKKSSKDSGAIKYEIFTQFVSDSIIIKDFGKKSKPVFYPLGRIEVTDEETYLYAKAAKDNKRVVYLIILDEKQKYAVGKAMIVTSTDAGSSQNTALDAKHTITSTIQYRTAKGLTIYRKEAYVYNKDASALTLILTESNDESATRQVDVYNPLDTFPKKNKYSGDYMQDKTNIVSIRDGKNDKEFLFFIHFEKENGICKGEIREKASFLTPGLAVYSEPGNPCVLQFIFKGNTVSLKEEKACGAFRDIKCFFDGSFTKKKEPKPAKESKAAVKKK
jgi:hypothetical protein